MQHSVDWETNNEGSPTANPNLPINQFQDTLPLTLPRHRAEVRPQRDSYHVEHHYTDRSNETIPKEILNVKTCRGGVKIPFPRRLFEILEEVETAGLAAILSWQPHGRSFVIHQPEVFARQLMPKYFSHSNLKSFQRQLNLYGFNRITQGPDKGGYYHEYFLRGKVHLTRFVERQRVKGTLYRGRSSPEREPDFYSMPFVGEQNNSVAIEAPKVVAQPPETDAASQKVSSLEMRGALDASFSKNSPTEETELQAALMDDLQLLVRPDDENGKHHNSDGSIDFEGRQFFSVDPPPRLESIDVLQDSSRARAAHSPEQPAAQQQQRQGNHHEIQHESHGTSIWDILNSMR